MGKVIPLNNVTRLDLPPDRVLEGAVGTLESVVIMGYAHDGAEYFASSIAGGADVLWLLERLKMQLLNIGEQND